MYKSDDGDEEAGGDACASGGADTVADADLDVVIEFELNQDCLDFDEECDPKLVLWAEREKHLWGLTEELAVDLETQNDLFDRCRYILNHYQINKYENAGRADYARSRELLTLLAQHADDMIAGFEELNIEFVTELLCARREAPGVRDQDSTFMFGLNIELKDFSTTAKWFAAIVPPQRVGAPGENLRRFAVGALAEVIEYYLGEEVKYRRWKNSVDSPHFVGRAGKFLCDFFLTLEPTMTERQLANTMRNIKEKARKKKSK